MAITLESLQFLVDTSSLDAALKKVEVLASQVGVLSTQLDNLSGSSKDAAKNEVELVKIKERLIKAQAKLEETQQKLSKSSEELATAQDKQRKSLPQEDELNRVQKILEREATVLKILTGQTIELADGNVTLSKTFSAGQASKLATLKLAGALSAEFNALAGSITQINSISQVNPFDKTAGSLEKMRKEVAELTKVNEYAARGFNLTKEQIVGLTRDIQSVTIASKQAGESTDQLQQRISKLELSTVAEANALNMLKQAARDSELAAKAHAKAEIERATAIARASQEADKQAANRRSMVGAGKEEQYKHEMDLLRSQYQAEEKLQLERQSMLKDSFSKEIQIKQWKSQQDQANYQADMKAFKDYYGTLEAEASEAERHLAAITSRINKEVAMTKFLNTGASRSTANIAAGMEVKGVPQDVINSFVKEATAKEQAAKASREMAAANEFLRETEQRLAASLDMSNASLNRASTDELVKIRTALDKSGLSADAAAIKFKGLEEKLREVSSKDKARDLQHLARAMSVQLGDVGVSLAGGMNPLLVMIQQGDQIRGVIQQVGADAQQMNGVMKTALGQIVSSFAMVGQAVGSFFVGSIQTAGKAVTDFGMQITGGNYLLDKFKSKMLDSGPPTREAAAAVDVLNKSMVILRTTTGLLVAGITLGLGALIVSVISAIKEQDQLTKTLVLQGAAMGVTTKAAYEQAAALQNMGIAQSDTLTTISAMAKAGNFTADQIQKVTLAAVGLQKYGGVAIEDTVKKFSEIGKDPVKAMITYAKETGNVSIEQLRLIDDLKETGKAAEAVKTAFEIMSDGSKKSIQQLKDESGTFMTMWINFKEVLKDIKSYFSDMGKTKFSKIDIGITEANLAQAEQDLKGAVDSFDRYAKERSVKFYKELLEKQKRLKENEDNANKPNAGKQFEEEQKALDGLDKFREKNYKKELTREEYIIKKLNERASISKDAMAAVAANDKELMKMFGKEWDDAQKKTGKSDTEKEADRILKYYERIREAALDAVESSKGFDQGLNKYEVTLNKLKQDKYWESLSAVQRKEIESLYSAASAQENLNIARDLSNKLLGQADKLGSEYHKTLRQIDQAVKNGFDPTQAELLKKALWDATEQGRSYISTLREMVNKTRELADARTTLNVERSATLAGSVTESEEIKRQGEINREKLRIEREYQLELQKIKDTYKGDAPETVKAREDLTKRNEELRKNALENLGIKNATQELVSFSLEFKLLIERTNEFGVSLEGAFGGFGKNISTAITAFTKLGATLEQNARLLESARDNPEQYAKLQKKLAKDEIGLYAQTAGAAKQMFGEKTAAAKAFGAIEKTLHIVRLGMLAVEMAESIKSVAVSLAADGAKKASALGTMVVDGTAAVVKSLASLPFPANLAAGAAVAAVVAGLIGSVGGSFNGKVSGSAPKYNEGTGTVFGDSKAKSESINNSISLLEKANSLTQKYSPQMLLHLRNIDSSIGGLVNLMIRTGGIEGKAPTVSTGSKINTVGGLGSSLVKVSNVAANLPIVGGITNKLVSAVVGSIFGKTKTTNLGSGITGGKQSLSDILGSGFNASYFTDVQIKKSGLFGSSTKYKTYMSEADAELEQQITAVFEGMYNSILLGAKALGGSQNEIVKQLDNFVVDIGKVKLTGTAQEMQETLTAVFGAAGDNIAKAVMPGLERFQKVGEGYLETLIRTATELENVNSWFDMLGKSMLQLSIGGVKASQSLIDLFGGVSNFETAVSDYYDNFYSEQEKVDTKVKQLTSAFASLGLELPKSIQGYRDIVNAQDMTTQSGQETFYSLISLSSAFKDIVESSSAFARSVEDYLAILRSQVRSNEDIANSIYDYMQQSSELEATYSDLVTGAKGVNSAVYKLATKGMHPLEKAAYDVTLVLQEQIDALTAKKKLEEDILASVTASRNTLVSSYQTEVSNLESTINRLKQFSQGIKQFKDSLALGALSPYTPGQKYAEASRQFEDVYKAALGGDQTAQGQLQSIAQSFLDASKVYNASNELYSKDFERVNAILGNTVEATDKAILLAQGQLDATKAQLLRLSEISIGVKSVEEALQGLANSVLKAVAVGLNPGSSNVGAVTAGTSGAWVANSSGSFYQSTGGASAVKTTSGTSIFGKNNSSLTEQQLVDYVNNTINAGGSLQIYNEAKDFGITLAELDLMMQWEKGTAAAWAKANGLPAFADGANNIPQDMFAQIHKGEAIIPAKFNPWNNGNSLVDNSDLVLEIQALRAEVKGLREQQHTETVAIIQGQNQAAESSASIISNNNSKSQWLSTNKPEIN